MLAPLFLALAGLFCIIKSMTQIDKKKVLVVGGGFGGVKTALELCKHDDFAITLLSDRDIFRYYPALYHTATGGLYEQTNIHLTTILDEQRVKIIKGTAAKLDRTARTLATTDGQTLHYDILVLALGVVTNYFGIKGLEEHAYGIKSWEMIQRFKHHIHEQLSSGEPELNYVIVGAGPTGIELAGALPAYLHKIMNNHGLPEKPFKITVVEAAPRLLPRSPEAISKAVAARLSSLGIELKLGMTVEGETADKLMVSGTSIASHTVVWTAGTANHPFFKENDFTLTERGKVQVDGALRAEDGIYVIGDNAGTQYSGLAQTALYDGQFVADDIVARAHGKQPKTYKPKKPVIVIPVGEGWASVEWGKRTFTGRMGWWLRLAADWIGFHDYEPWWKASEQWMTEFGEQEDCPTCADKP